VVDGVGRTAGAWVTIHDQARPRTSKNDGAQGLRRHAPSGLRCEPAGTNIKRWGKWRHPVRRLAVQALRHSHREECARMDESNPPSISPHDLYGAIGTAAAPILIDVRRSGAFAA